MFKKLIVVMISLFFISFGSISAYATFDDNSNNNENKAYGGDADQHQKQSQYQDQNQGQYSKQANGQTTNVGGEKTEVLAPGYPDLDSTKGKNESQVGSPYAIIGVNEESPRIRFQHQLMMLDILLAKEIITKEEYDKEALSIYKQIKKANKEAKAIGVLPVCKNPILRNTVCW